MSLSSYKAKRDLKRSPEPSGGKPSSNNFKFVVQKHKASHLHYDFRLEMDGVLKSWAIPKGPSTNPAIKRLAVMVEDHPFDYRSFEGIIPSGYGAGTVMVWDEGDYEPDDVKSFSKSKINQILLKQLEQGKIKFTLHGKKLKGKFALVKSHRDEKQWLLMKLEDTFASASDITKKNKSVVSGKTLEEIQASKDSVKYESMEDEVKIKEVVSKKKSALPSVTKKAAKNSTSKTAKPTPTKVKKNITKSVSKDIINNSSINKSKTKNVIHGVTSSFLKSPIPMLATAVEKPFDKKGWIYEIKWDGYRAMAACSKNEVNLLSRNQKSFNVKFYPIYEALRTLQLNAVLDGEIVVLRENGQANFGDLQNWRSEADGGLYYYIFDLLWLNGKNLCNEPLTVRRNLLRPLLPEDGIIRLSENYGDQGIIFFEAAKAMGLEGIMAKKEDSTYIQGFRTKDWLKIKANKRQEMVIGGFTKNDGSSKQFSSLLLGVYDNKKLLYTGKVGTGFNEKQQQELLKKFTPLIINKSPFAEMPDINKPSRFRHNPPNAKAFWMKPKLVCEVSFTEMTSDGIMRHPSFEGLRNDKAAKDVVKEVVISVPQNPEATSLDKSIQKPGAKNKRGTLLNPGDKTQVKKVNGHTLTFTNLDKIYWPGENITKRDLINYYYRIAPIILPYLKGRPQSLNRFPDGIKGKSFYQKDITGKAPDWLERYGYRSSDEPNIDKHFLVPHNDASLLYMASLGAIEMNPWSSRIIKPDNPDWCIIDLDPADNTFEQVIKAARITYEILQSAGADSYVKTSGSTGIHIYIPLNAKYTYDQSKEFARLIAKLVHNEIPKYTSIERAVKDRKGKMYIDFLQNRPQATVAAPYSLRPKPGATVSMPIHWDEVKKGLTMKQFTIHNAIERIEQVGDIFSPVLGKGINLNKVIKNLNG